MVSPGSFTELNANSGFLYLGGLPPSMFAGVNNSLLMPGDELPPPALVCFHAISINGDYQDLRCAEIICFLECCFTLPAPPPPPPTVLLRQVLALESV